MEIDKEHLVDGKYTFEALVDLSRLKEMFERFSQATGFTTGLVSYPDQKLLIKTAWRDICTKFHRAVPTSEIHCKQSNMDLTSRLKNRKELNVRRCESGLVDGATPIIIKGAHVANLFTGQILFEEPDFNRFREQGAKYGFNIDDYLEALSKVPVVTENEFKEALGFLSEMAVMLAEQGLSNLKNIESAQLAKENEEKLKNMADLLPQVIFEADIEGNLEFVNKQAYHLLGYSEHDFEKGLNLLQLLSPEDKDRAQKETLNVLTTKHVTQSEYLMKKRDGSNVPVTLYSSPIIRNDRVMGFRGIIIDITQHKKAEEALRESEGRLRLLVDNMGDMISRHKANSAITYVSPSSVNILGMTQNELIGRCASDFVHPNDANLTMRIIDEAVANNYDHYRLQHRLRQVDNSYKWVETIGKLFYDSNNELTEIQCNVRDISESKNAEEALKKSEDNLRTTLNSIGDAVIAVDSECRLTQMNPIAEKLTGWSFEEAKNETFTKIFNIINEDTRETLENPINSVSSKGVINDLPSRTILISKDGREYNITDSIAPIKDNSGKISGVVLVFRDITEQLKMEKELLKSKKLESIGVLAGGIAHDFNNILMGLFGNIELAKLKTKKEHEAYPFIETANQALDRATNMTKQLLTFAKGGAPILETVNFQEIVKSSVEFNLSGSNVKAHLNFPEDVWQIRADKGQIDQVLTNLTINANQSMPDGGNIYIDIENIEDFEKNETEDIHKRQVKFQIRDEGIGISHKYLDRIFDPYFSTKQTGSGLGLATVHSIISKHNGQILVNSVLGTGTTFTIYLPALSSHEKSTIVDKKEANENLKSSYRILVIDDEEIIRDTSRAMLTSLGYSVDSAIDGDEALLKYVDAQKSEIPFDIVIADLTIPGGMGGKETVKKLLEINPAVLVIVSSGYSTDPIIANYCEYGFKGRLVKPFKLKDLEAEIRKVIEE